jgi:hypothetical protein
MAPKPKPKHNPIKPEGAKDRKAGSAFSNLDDFIDSGADIGNTSAVQVGDTVQEKQRQTLREKYQEGRATEALQLNMMKLG